MLAFDNKLAEGQPAADEITVGKANLVLKAAGLNASLITMEQLRFTAPVIFVKIYEAFFDEKVTGINYSPAGRDDHCLNAELIVRALEERFKYQFLERVTGASIMQGDKFSIESIVDLFYGVTQKNLSHKSSWQNHDDMHRATASSNTIRQYYHTQKRYPNLIPGELKILMDRVATLEKKLHTGESSSNIATSPKKKKKKSTKTRRRRHTSQSENIMHDGADDNFDGDSDQEIDSPQSNTAFHANNRDDEMEVAHPMKVQGLDSSPSKQTRPSSAPPGGRPRSKSKKSPARKIKYKTSNDIRDKEVLSKLCPAAPTLDELEELRKAQLAKQKEEERKRRQREEEFDKMYTYDTLTGRKLLIAEMERIVEKRHMEHMKKQREDEKLVGREKVKRSHSDPPAPTRAEWPGHRTETSAHAFVDRMSKIRAPPPEEKYPSLNYAQRFAAYDDMDKLDIVISVEHCCNCSFHAMSLRHKPAEYITHANSVLRDLAQVAHQYHPCARVGVVRFNANITKKSKESDVNSRIGALEVQVAYKNADGVVIPELIYSKLKTRRWPSKSVIEKRLRSFMSSVNIQMYEADENDAYDDEMVNGCHTYPVGVGSWEDTALSQTLWQYSSPGTANVRFPVEWVFDSRKRASFPRFKDGTVIYVENVENEHGYTERYARLGVVKRSFKSAAYVDMVEVKLKYTDEEICVAEENCFPPESYNANYEFEIVNGLPQPLLTALRFFAVISLDAKWMIMDERYDSNVRRIGPHGKLLTETHLCRPSFFKQIYEIAWKGILAHGTDDMEMTDVQTNEVVDVQLCYSEDILNRVFMSSDGIPLSTVNVSELLWKCEVDFAVPWEVNGDDESKDPGSFEDAAGNKDEGKELDLVNEDAIENNESSAEEYAGKDDDALHYLNEANETTEQQKIVTEAIQETIADVRSNSIVEEQSEVYQSTTLNFRERLKQVCLKIAPPAENSVEAGPLGRDITTSKYKAGALVIFEALDSDGNRELDIKEFQEALVKFQLNCEETEINKLWAGFDTDGDARITLDEFLQFLHFDTASTVRDLGDIWSSLRGSDENDSLSTPEKVQVAFIEMEKDLFSICAFDSTVGSVVPATSFLEILDKYELNKRLMDGDLAILMKVFGLDAKTKQPLVNFNGNMIDNSELQKIIVKYDDFCSWLQPVDVTKVIKRISRFVNAIIKSNSNIPENDRSEYDISSLDDLIAIIDPTATGFLALPQFQLAIDKMGLPVSRAEVRVIFRNFGTSDGESMTHTSFVKMITGSTSVEVTPIQGSRQFRKQSVMMNNVGLKHIATDLSLNALEELDDVFEEDDAVQDVYPVKYEPKMVSFSVVELTGSVLEEESMKKFQVEIIFLLQNLVMNVGREHKQSHGKRHLDVDWDPLELSATALNNNANIAVRIITLRGDGNENVLGTTFFSPRQLMEYDKDSFFDLPLSIVLDNGNEVKINIFGRLKECHNKKLANFAKHAESANFNVSFDDYKFEQDDDDDYNYSDHDHENEKNDDFLANFATSGLLDLQDPLEESKAGKEIEFDINKKYSVTLRSISLQNLNKSCGHCIKLAIGSFWSMETAVDAKGKDKTEWNYGEKEQCFLIEGNNLQGWPIKVESYEVNDNQKNVVGAASTYMIHAKYHHDDQVLLECDLSHGGEVSSHAILLFDFDEYYVPEDPSHDDRTLLFDFKRATSDNSEWADDMMWSEMTELKNWLGVDASHDTIVGLHLGGNNLNGSFPSNFCGLQSLIEIELFNNDLRGPIPENIGDLKNLRILLLNNNNLTGEIPASISNCSKLEELDLSCNKLCGHIPPAITITTLTVLALDDNDFSGSLPVSLTSLKKLRTLTCDLLPYDDNNFYKAFPYIVSHSDITSKIPPVDDDQYWGNRSSEEKKVLEMIKQFDDNDCFSSWVLEEGRNMLPWPGVYFDGSGHLRSLILFEKNLCAGQIPEKINMLSNVIYIDLSDNEIGGYLPSELFELPQLEHLFLNNNRIEGTLASDIAQLYKLKTLDLSGNQLTGFLPSELSSLEVLSSLNLKSNNLEGSIPEEVFMLEKLKELNFSHNSLTGPIPDLSDLISLERLVLSGNQLTGCIPDTIGQVSCLEHLDVSFNQLIGGLPSCMSDLPRLDELDIQMTDIKIDGDNFNMRKKLLLRKVPSLKHISL